MGHASVQWGVKYAGVLLFCVECHLWKHVKASQSVADDDDDDDADEHAPDTTSTRWL